MNAYHQILAKQEAWAHNVGLDLIGSEGTRGKKVYTSTLDDNLFKPLHPQTRKELAAGDGGEINGTDDKPAKMQALHSSSAMGVNLFDYWRDAADLSLITSLCGLSRSSNKISGEIRFEQKFSIDNHFQYSPNIDVIILPNSGAYRCYAIECKFSEAYSGHGHGGLDPKYFNNVDNWKGLSATRKLAEEITPDDRKFKYLHAAQLIKHILGLNRVYKQHQYRLLYLRYDALGKAGCIHTQEVEDFADIVRSDGVIFHETTYQYVIARLTKYREDHADYVKYLTGRYL